MPNDINTQVWLNLGSGQPDGVGPGSDDQRVLDVERAINLGINVYEEDGGLTFNGAGAIKGGKTAYDVGTGFWLGGVPDDFAFKVAIGNPNANTFNFDGEFIDAQMRNLELTGYLRGPSTFTIDPATHGDNTGTVVIAGNLQVDGTTTTVNSTVVEIDDIAVLLGAEATTASLANNGGIILGTYTNNPFILYRSSFDSWEVNKDWTPNTNNTKDLGNTSKRWQNLYLGGTADIEGALQVDGNVVLGDSTSDTITMNGRVFSDIIPAGNLQHDLGASGLRWANLYAGNGDFSGNLDVDGNTTIGGTLTSTGNITSPNMADDLTATVSGSNININLVANNNSVLGSVVLAPGSNISLSESSDVITISSSQVQSNWNETNSSDPSFIQNKPTIPPTPVQSNWNETNSSSLAFIQNKPTIPPTPVQSNWNETNSSSLAFIQNKPTIPAAQVNSDWNETNSSSLAFIQNKPTIPAAQVNSDWNATSGIAQILNKPTIPTTISSLTDTTISGIQNGDILKYNTTSSKWENVRDTVVQYSVSPSPCAHYYIDIVEKGDVVTLQAALHIAQETASTNTWTSTIQAPSGGSVPQPANTIAVGTGLTTGTTTASYKTYVAQLDQNGIIQLVSTEPRAIIDTFTGDGTTAEFTLTEEPRNKDENNTMVHVNGTYTPKNDYSVGIQTTKFRKLTFSSAPANGASIEVITQSAPGFVTVDELKDSGANFVFINITFVK
jgi:cytoskeletal protein CcmA (bactofilin family)